MESNPKTHSRADHDGDAAKPKSEKLWTLPIFKISDYIYEIYCAGNFDYSELSNVFHREIRPITTPVKIVNKKPSVYVMKLPNITDTEVASSFEGLPLTRYDLISLIAAKFGKRLVHALDENFEDKVLIFFCDKNADADELARLNDFIAGLKLVFDHKLEYATDVDSALKLNDKVDVMRIEPSCYMERIGLPYLRQEEEFWFNLSGSNSPRLAS